MNKIKQHVMDTIKYDCPPSSIKAKIGTRITRGSFLFEKQRSGGWKVVQGKKLRKWLTYWYVEKQLPMRQVSEQTGIAHSTLQNLLLDMGIMRSKKVSWEERAKTVEKYAEDLSSLNRLSFRDEKYLAYWLSKTSGIPFTKMQLTKAATRCDLKIVAPDDLYTQFLDKNQELIKHLYLNEGYTPTRIVKKVRKASERPEFNLTVRVLINYLKSKDIYEYGRRQERRLGTKGTHGIHLLKYAYTGKYGEYPTREQFLLGLDVDKLKYGDYKKAITYATSTFMRLFPDEYSMIPEAKRHSGLALDHKYSKMYGYYEFDESCGDFVKRDKVVPLHIMCHPLNLARITERANMMKGSACSITLKRLRKSVKESDTDLKRLVGSQK